MNPMKAPLPDLNNEILARGEREVQEYGVASSHKRVSDAVKNHLDKQTDVAENLSESGNQEFFKALYDLRERMLIYVSLYDNAPNYVWDDENVKVAKITAGEARLISEVITQFLSEVESDV